MAARSGDLANSLRFNENNTNIANHKNVNNTKGNRSRDSLLHDKAGFEKLSQQSNGMGNDVYDQNISDIVNQNNYNTVVSQGSSFLNNGEINTYVNNVKVDTNFSVCGRKTSQEPEIDISVNQGQQANGCDIGTSVNQENYLTPRCMASDLEPGQLITEADINNVKLHVSEESVDISEHTEENICDVPICDVPFTVVKNLSYNEKISSDEKLFRCKLCQTESFNNVSLLSEHMSSHSEETLHKCGICSKMFSNSEDLNQHVRTHNGEALFSCDICDEIFEFRQNLLQHKRTHSGTFADKKVLESEEDSGEEEDEDTKHLANQNQDAEQNVHDCHDCGKGLEEAEIDDLYNRMKAHNEVHILQVLQYRCHVCEKGFSNSEDLSEHVTLHNADVPLKCVDCGEMFNEIQNLYYHMKSHEDIKRYYCNQCDIGFNQSQAFTEHIRIHSGEKPFQCGVCSKTFTSSRNLTQHLRVHTGERPFKCEVCGKTFGLRSNLSQHLKMHSGEKPHQCTFCEKAFVLRGNLLQHIRTHTEKVQFKCSVCNRLFNHKSSLDRHKRMHTNSLRKESNIDEKDPSELKTVTHSNEMYIKREVIDGADPDLNQIDAAGKNYCSHMIEENSNHCDICGIFQNQTLQSGDKMDGQSNNTAPKPFKCGVCDKSFSLRTTLSSHMMTHTGEKPFKCDLCDKTFTQRSSLRSHMKVHTGERPYKCDVCGKSFGHVSNLYKHQAVHTGDKPYKCDICDKTFSQSSGLSQHVKIHTGERIYKH